MPLPDSMLTGGEPPIDSPLAPIQPRRLPRAPFAPGRPRTLRLASFAAR